LTTSGLPVTGVLKIVYPCDSKYIVESKSIKLYLNSFNMFRNGDTREIAVVDMVNTVQRDLSSLLETDVAAVFHPANNNEVTLPVYTDDECPCLEYDIIDSDVTDKLVFDTYEETPELIESITHDEPQLQMFRSALLKSNCRVTSQPDWGDVYVKIIGKKHVDPISMLKYIVSFRNECHFHEEICEMVYKHLSEAYEPEQLMVACLYTRRGGIDINPIRASHSMLIPEFFTNPDYLIQKTLRQ